MGGEEAIKIFSILEEEILNKFHCNEIDKKILVELTKEVSRISENILSKRYTSPHTVKLEFLELVSKYYNKAKSDGERVELLEYSRGLAKYLNSLLEDYPIFYIH